MQITILQKSGPLTAPFFVSNLNKALGELKSDLSASAKVAGTTRSGWTRVELTGEDEEVLCELVTRKFGLAHTDFNKVEDQGVYDALAIGSSPEALRLDLGIESPKSTIVKIPLFALRAQLTDGNAIACRDIVENYCLVAGVKVTVRITKKNPDEIEGWLSDEQIKGFSDWFQTGLDRILVFDCFKQQLESAVSRASLNRDIISVESQTFTTQIAVCKLGTDAIGLMPKLGTQLKKHGLKPFIPKRIGTRCRQW
jgi:hypothetical protein